MTSPQMALSTQRKLLPWIIPVIFQLLFLLNSLTTSHTHTRDSQEYLNQAYNILHHQTFYCGEPGQPVTDVSLYSRRPPGYGLFILLTSFFLTVPVLTLLAQSALSIFNIYLTYRIVKFIKPEFNNPIIITLLACTLPTQFIMAATYMSEIPFQTAVLLSGFYILRYEREDGSFKHFYLHHFFIFCAYMIKPVAGLLWVISAIYLIITQKETRSVIRLILLSTVHLLVMSLSLLRNYHYTGIAEGSSIPHKVVVNYNLPILLKEIYGESRAAQIMDSLQKEMSTESYAYQCAISDQFIRSQIADFWPSYLKIHARGMIKFFTDPGRWEIILWEHGWEKAEQPISLVDQYKKSGFSGVLKAAGIRSLLLTFWSAIGSIIIVILVTMWFFRKKETSTHKIFIGGILLYFSFMIGPSASARLRIPAYPFMIAAAAIMCNDIIQGKRAASNSTNL